MRIREFAGIQLNVGRDVMLFFAYMFFANIGFGVFTLIFNLYVYALDYREDAIGVFSSVQTFTMAATALVLGNIIGRVGLWLVIVVGVTSYGLSCVGLALSTWSPALLLFSAISGMGLAVIFTATMPFIIEYARLEDRTSIATIAFSVASLSATLGSLIGGFAPILLSKLIPAVDAGSPAAYRAALLAGSVLGLAGVIPLLRMGEARRSHQQRQAASAAVRSEPEQEGARARVDVGVFVLVGLITAFGAGLVVPFYNVFLQSLGASPRAIGLIYAAGGIAAAIIGLGAPLVSRRVGSLNAVLLIRGAPLPLYLLLIGAPWYALAVVAHVVRQVSINMAWPVDSTFISELLPAKFRAAVFGWRSATWNLGIGLSSVAGGWLIVQHGYGITFAGYVVFTAVALGLYYFYYLTHPRVAAGRIPSALSVRQRARRAIRQTERVVGTVDGVLPGSVNASHHPDISQKGASEQS